ncbi:Glycoside hydrolase family 16 protein [Mycena kentingensis (nom. inval.)]|nr:Glycoside hydrolase family 16 protein [Mycena kentingensis (nom. inval.)]
MYIPTLIALGSTFLSLRVPLVLATEINAFSTPNYALARRAKCIPFQADFTAPDAQSVFAQQFTLVDGTYGLTKNGLEIYLYKPSEHRGEIEPDERIDKGTLTFTLASPTVAGIVTAGILIGTSTLDEIDMEHICAEHNSFQTNMFSEPPGAQPEYNLGFSAKHGVDNIARQHSYSIAIDSQQIKWALDGAVVRTLQRGDCMRNGIEHFPTHEMRFQLGIWDASSPAGTAAWAKGPVDWNSAPDRITATFTRVELEC